MHLKLTAEKLRLMPLKQKAHAWLPADAAQRLRARVQKTITRWTVGFPLP